jgi:hypothetical protein
MQGWGACYLLITIWGIGDGNIEWRGAEVGYQEPETSLIDGYLHFLAIWDMMDL